MSMDIPPLRRSSAKALDERLAAWLGWFETAPLPEGLESLVDQLEAAYAQTAADRAGTPVANL